MSICADYFMDRPLLRCSQAENAELLERLQWLLGICPEMGVGRVVLPFVDASRIRDESERDQVAVSYTHLEQPAPGRYLVLNADTFLDAEGYRLMVQGQGNALLGVRVDDRSRYGSLEVDAAGRLLALREKGREGPGLINAGVYACLLYTSRCV